MVLILWSKAGLFECIFMQNNPSVMIIIPPSGFLPASTGLDRGLASDFSVSDGFETAESAVESDLLSTLTATQSDQSRGSSPATPRPDQDPRQIDLADVSCSPGEELACRLSRLERGQGRLAARLADLETRLRLCEERQAEPWLGWPGPATTLALLLAWPLLTQAVVALTRHAVTRRR